MKSAISGVKYTATMMIAKIPISIIQNDLSISISFRVHSNYIDFFEPVKFYFFNRSALLKKVSNNFTSDILSYFPILD